MNEVGVDFVKFIKSHPVDTDFNAKDVNKKWLENKFQRKIIL